MFIRGSTALSSPSLPRAEITSLLISPRGSESSSRSGSTVVLSLNSPKT